MLALRLKGHACGGGCDAGGFDHPVPGLQMRNSDDEAFLTVETRMAINY
jgi:hypothetical protein